MVGKRVQFNDETWLLINLMRRERRRSFQQLADEAFLGLLEKHHHPIGLKEQLRESVGKPTAKKRRAKEETLAIDGSTLQHRASNHPSVRPIESIGGVAPCLDARRLLDGPHKDRDRRVTFCG